MIKYFDCAATGYFSPKMHEIYEEVCDREHLNFNPSSIYENSRYAKQSLEFARKRILSFIGGFESDKLVFTSGGSESNNLAIKGWAFQKNKEGIPAYIYLSPVEHPSVVNTVDWLYENGFIEGYTFIPFDEKKGCVDIDNFSYLLEMENPDNNFLVCTMAVNNETGVINDIKAIADLTHKYNGVLHVDGVQALGHLSINLRKVGVDMFSVSGHKLGVPRGAGFLYIKDGIEIQPLIHGGGQEHGYRAGTENVLDITVLYKAIEYKNDVWKILQETLLHDYFIERLKTIDCNFHVNGDNSKIPIINVTFEGIDNEQLITVMDHYEECQISAGSACSNGTKKPSRVLMAMGLTEKEINNTVRISFNSDYTKDDIDSFVRALERSIKRIKTAGG